MQKLTDEQRISGIIARVVKTSVDSVLDAKNLKEDIDMDSLHEVEIVMEIEKEFDTTIPDEDYGGFTTLKQFINLLEPIRPF